MPEAPLETYLTTTNDGLQVNVQALCGGRLRLFDPDQGIFVTEQLGNGGIPTLQHCFDNTLYIEGIPNQSAQDGVPYYIGMMKLPGGAKKICFWTRGFSDLQNRYVFQPGEGIPVYTDPLGNKATLIGMGISRNGSLLSTGLGPNAGALTSNQPWSRCPAQSLSINSSQLGITFQNPNEQELDTRLGVISCAWAWRGVVQNYGGRMANGANTPDSTIFMRAFARNVLTNAIYYGPTGIHQTKDVGRNTMFSALGVHLALDDGIYYYGLNAWTAGGAQVSMSVENVVESWV